MRENLMTVSPAGVAMAEEDIFSFDATEGGVAGMCAHGGLVVDLEWKDGKPTSAAIKATAKDCSVKVKGFEKPFDIAKGETVKLKFS